MDRLVSEKTILEKFAIKFASIVERYAKYIIVSGFVAIMHGRSRGTEDIDIIIEKTDKETFTKLHKELLKAGFECLQSKDPGIIFDDYLNQGTSIRYIEKGTFVPEIELKFAKDELDEYQLKTRKKLPLIGSELFFSSIEANIAFKEELLKSDKDLEDARHLRIIYSGKLDEQEIKRIKEMIKRLRL